MDILCYNTYTYIGENMKKNINEITWLKLDNAATIYPSTISRKYITMFRLTITLIDNIDNKVLYTAINNTLKRFPTFSFTLKQGFFWCYFDKIKEKPIISEDTKNPMVRIDFDKNNKYLFRVRTFKNRIALEVFHALTDGTGALKFLLTLTQEYLRLKYKIKPEYTEYVLNPNEEAKPYEIADAFLKVTSTKGNLVHEKSAFHQKGTLLKSDMISIITGIINTNELKKITKKYNTSITEFLTSLLIYSYQELKKEKNIINKKEIKVSIPINLRNMYDVKTLRNFSSYINVGIKPDHDYSLEQIIKEVKSQIKEMNTYEFLNAKISGNVKLMKNYFIRRIPMFIKKHIMSLIESKMGDGYITTSLSNLGNVDLPNNMKKYVTDMNFILGKSRGKSASVSCIGYNNKVYITFSSIIKETDAERIFFTELSKMGLDVYIESNR